MSLSLEGIRSIQSNHKNITNSPLFELDIIRFLLNEGFLLSSEGYIRKWTVHDNPLDSCSWTYTFCMNIYSNQIVIEKLNAPHAEANRNKIITFSNDFVSAYNKALDILKEWGGI